MIAQSQAAFRRDLPELLKERGNGSRTTGRSGSALRIPTSRCVSSEQIEIDGDGRRRAGEVERVAARRIAQQVGRARRQQVAIVVAAAVERFVASAVGQRVVSRVARERIEPRIARRESAPSPPASESPNSPAPPNSVSSSLPPTSVSGSVPPSSESSPPAPTSQLVLVHVPRRITPTHLDCRWEGLRHAGDTIPA